MRSSLTRIRLHIAVDDLRLFVQQRNSDKDMS
jgi:hypothetical protein